MPKRIRRNYEIYLAPNIVGFYDNNGRAKAIDEKKGVNLDPNNIDDKIYIYERQVKKWFLERANRLIKGGNNGFIVLMICLSYLEGVEQYIRGQESNGHSKEFFRYSMHRIYPYKFQDNELNNLYSEARCGLFHNGMVSGKILISKTYNDSVYIPDAYTIQINPQMLLNDINQDFKKYLMILRNHQNNTERIRFDNMFSNL
jgi:hypothetical protein